MPFPPPAAVITEQPNKLQDVIALVDSLRKAMIESHEKIRKPSTEDCYSLNDTARSHDSDDRELQATA